MNWQDIKAILDIAFWVLPPVMKPSEEEEYYTKILEEYNRICDTSKVTPR